MDIHIILDIDQTLVDSMSLIEYNNYRSNKKIRAPDFMKESMCIWMRPHLKELIEFLDKNVKYISIWTNGSFSWLYYVVHTILSKFISIKRFLLLLSVEYSIRKSIQNNGVDYIIPIKMIDTMLDIVQNNNISLQNTVLIDDNYYNCYYNKSNTIPIKKYLATEESIGIRINDLLFIKKIVNELKKSKNIQKTLNGVYNGMSDYNKLFTLVPNSSFRN